MGTIKLFSNKPEDERNAPKRQKKAPAQPREIKNAPRAEKKAKAVGANDNKKSGGRKTAIIICAIVLVLCIGTVLLGVYANGLETVYPNVSMEGTDLSGMTVEQAANALSGGSIGSAEDKELRVTLPAECELVISAKDAGCYLSAPDAAVFVYNTCHDGGFAGNTITYLRCLFGGLSLSVSDGAELNENYIRKATDEAVRAASVALMENDLEVGEESISIVKGAGAVSLDKNELFDKVVKALKAGDFLPIKYMSSEASSSNPAVQEIDLQELYDTIYQEPKNAEYDPELKAATEHICGREFDMNEAKRLWDSAQNGELVVIPLLITEPEVTTKSLNDMLFADLLSQKSTSLAGSSAARVNNITKAAAAINGIVLNPGDEFSYNGALGQRTAAAGYQAAGAYSAGKVVSEIGGGICQVSSTLYYCTLIANLKITQRTCHYFGVNYLPAGLDATVSWPSPDFKFKNDGEYPIKIEAGIDKEAYTVYVKIFGSNPEGIRVEMTTETWGTADGYGAASYRWVYDKDGNLISKNKESTSQYHYHVEEKESPSPSPSESPSPSPSTAPASPSPSAPVQPSAPVESQAPVTTPPATETTPPVTTPETDLSFT